MNENVHTESLATPALFERAKAEQDEDARWKYITALHRRADREVVDEAMELLNSENADDRVLGLDILGQVGTPAKPFLDERLSRVKRLLGEENDPGVLAAGATALGHLGDPRGIDPLVQLAHHPNEDVRFAVAWALPPSLGSPEDERGIQRLIELSNDQDEKVRDWAVFGLGTRLDSDSTDVREALYQRIDDPDDDTRDEALLGLARRGDMRVIEPLLTRLRSDEVSELNVEAAREIGASGLHEALVDLRSWWDIDPNLLTDAIERCQPEA